MCGGVESCNGSGGGGGGDGMVALPDTQQQHQPVTMLGATHT